mgnify:FL=1
MTRIPQASENPYEPIPVTLAERRAAARKWFGHGRSERAYLGRHVYFIDVPNWEGVIKIGSAFDVEIRRRQLQACSPLQLQLRIAGWIDRGGQALEHALHFAKRRAHDEWFWVHLNEIKPAARMGAAVIEVPIEPEPPLEVES